jgi:transglutaminase-like putative cysteine protease
MVIGHALIGRRNLIRAALVPAALAGMFAIAALTLGRIYSGDLLPRLAFGAAVLSIGLSVLVRRLPAWSAAPVSVLGLAAYTYLAVWRSAEAGAVAGTVPDLARDAFRNGIPRLLTAMIPIEPQPDTVIMPVVAAWLAGLTAAELAVRGRRVLLSYAAPTVLLGGALYVVGPNARPSLWLPLAFVGFAALGLAASARPREDTEAALTRAQRTTLRVRVTAGAAAGLAIIGALAAAVGPSVADQVENTPTDPRRYVAPPQLDSLDENPLVRLSGWALNPDQHLFDANVNMSGSQNTRIRLAVLSDYDGVTWRVGATYRNAGRILSGPPSADGLAGDPVGDGEPDSPPGKEIEQEIRIAELDGRLLPGAATPRRVDGVRVAYDPVTGTLALPEGLRPGLNYTVHSRQPALEVNLLPSAEVPSGSDVMRYLSLPGTVPEQMKKLAEQLGAGVSSPYQRATAVEQFLAEHYQLVADAPSGHSYPNLNYFMFGPRNAGGQRGTSEQFAAAFAVLGRALGLPTRVCVGFQARSGKHAVRGVDAFAWPEVLFNGLGWVSFDPLPQPNSKPRPVEDDFRPRADPSTPPPSPAPLPSVSLTPKPAPTASAPAAPPSTGDGRFTAALIVAGSGTGVGLLGFLLAVPLLRRALRRRRLSGPPPQRVLGAWAEVLDALRLAGRGAPDHLAASEVARHAATAAEHHERRRAGPRLPAPAIDELARLVNIVAYAPGQVSPQADDAQAGRAVEQADAYVTELRARRSSWHRLLWWFDPRPLRWAKKGRSPY